MWYNVNYVFALLRKLINLTVPFRSSLSQTLASFSSTSHFSLSLSHSLVFLWGLIGRRPSCPKKKKSWHLANFRPSIGPTGLKALNLSHTISLYCHSRSLLSPPSSASDRSSSSPFSPVSLSNSHTLLAFSKNVGSLYPYPYSCIIE